MQVRFTTRVICALAIVALVQACSRQKPSSAFSAKTLEDVSALMSSEMEKQQVPGGSLVVMKGDDVILARGYGKESVEREDAVAPMTVFPLNSVSKQLTAALVLKLAEERKLTLDDPVARYLPNFTHLPPGLTIRHLLNHTSGMRDLFAQPKLNAIVEKLGSSTEEFLVAARDLPADFEPGSRWCYANINYLMLALIAERLTGQPCEEALDTRFFRPLKLSSMGPCPSHPGDERGTARGHTRSENRFLPHPPENFHLFRGSGGYRGNAVDLARWTRALATGKIVSAESYAQMITPARFGNGRTADYGFAMVLLSPDGVTRRGHGGYGGGFSEQAAYYPEAELTVVVMFNRFLFPEYAERKIARRLFGLPDATLREASLSPEQRQDYVGSYDLGVINWYPKVAEREDKLWFELDGSPPQPLTYVGHDEFVREGEPYGYRLVFGPPSPPREVRIQGMGLMNWYGIRRPSPSSGP